MNNRIIFIDTETTGLSPAHGHRIIEIAAVEMINRKLTGNTYQAYINPERGIDVGAFRVHGIESEFLQTKPLFADIAYDFYGFISEMPYTTCDIVAHNAHFDVDFINNEYSLLNEKHNLHGFKLEQRGSILCTKRMSQLVHEDSLKKHTLDALKSHYKIDIEREKHGALIDAQILAEVYLKMTEGWYL